MTMIRDPLQLALRSKWVATNMLRIFQPCSYDFHDGLDFPFVVSVILRGRVPVADNEISAEEDSIFMFFPNYCWYPYSFWIYL